MRAQTCTHARVCEIGRPFACECSERDLEIGDPDQGRAAKKQTMPKTGAAGLAALLTSWRGTEFATAISNLGITSAVQLAEDELTTKTPDAAELTRLLARFRGKDGAGPDARIPADDDAAKAILSRLCDRANTGLDARKEAEDAAATHDGGDHGGKTKKLLLRAARKERYVRSIEMVKLQRRRPVVKVHHPSKRDVRLVGEGLEESYAQGQPRLPLYTRLEKGFPVRESAATKEKKKKRKRDEDDSSSDDHDAETPEELQARPFGAFYLACRALAHGGASDRNVELVEPKLPTTREPPKKSPRRNACHANGRGPDAK